MTSKTEYQREWRKQNPEKRAEQKRRWREKNQEHIREYRRAYREKNLEKVKEYHNQWNKDHREQINTTERERAREKAREQARQREERRRELERQSQIQLIAERRQTAMWLEAMGMPAQRINPTPATAAALNQLAADEFFSRKRERATILEEKPPRPSDRWHNSDASARKSAALRAQRREAARARKAAYKTPAQLARLAEEARMDAIAREINARLRLKK